MNLAIPASGQLAASWKEGRIWERTIAAAAIGGVGAEVRMNMFFAADGETFQLGLETADTWGEGEEAKGVEVLRSIREHLKEKSIGSQLLPSVERCRPRVTVTIDLGRVSQIEAVSGDSLIGRKSELIDHPVRVFRLGHGPGESTRVRLIAGKVSRKVYFGFTPESAGENRGENFLAELSQLLRDNRIPTLPSQQAKCLLWQL